MTSKNPEPVRGIEIVDLGLYLKEYHILIISDLHIGYEEALNKQGVFVPKFHFKDLVKRLESLFKKLGRRPLDIIVINGDLKHEFGRISDEEWRNTLKLLDLLSKHSERTVFIQGNHDRILGPIADKNGVELVQEFLVGDTLIIHGDAIVNIPSSVKTIIIGHEHPAVTLSEGVRSETFKCFLKGRYKRKDLLVQPSFNQLIEGTDILSGSLLSPFLKQKLDSFEVFIVADSVYPFGTVKKIREKLD